MKTLPSPGPDAEQIGAWLRSRNYADLNACVADADLPEDFRHALLKDLYMHEQGSISAGSSKVKQLINSLESNRIYGMFSAPYFPSLGLDGLHYEPLPLPDYPGLDFSSPVVPVSIVSATPGFYEKPVVALFPENHIDQIQTPDDKIFYFINKFVERHIERTRPILRRFTEKGAFAYIEDMGAEDVADACVHWVWLHERFHREGPAPVPEFLDIKSYRPLAGLEECRVDMEAICRIHDTPDIPHDRVNTICMFIMAERLLRYSIEGIPAPNYDAIGSQVLVNYLRRHGYLWMKNGLMGLSSEYIAGLRDFVSQIREIELQVHDCPREEVREKLLNFVNANMNLPYDSRAYKHDDFFLGIQHELQASH